MGHQYEGTKQIPLLEVETTQWRGFCSRAPNGSGQDYTYPETTFLPQHFLPPTSFLPLPYTLVFLRSIHEYKIGIQKSALGSVSRTSDIKQLVWGVALRKSLRMRFWNWISHWLLDNWDHSTEGRWRIWVSYSSEYCDNTLVKLFHSGWYEKEGIWKGCTACAIGVMPEMKKEMVSRRFWCWMTGLWLRGENERLSVIRHKFKWYVSCWRSYWHGFKDLPVIYLNIRIIP
jgi:hypothetical protein